MRARAGVLARPSMNKTRRLGWMAVLAALNAGPASSAPLDLSRYELRPVYVNRFDQAQKIAREEDLIVSLAEGGWRRARRPPDDAEWIAEGHGSSLVREGRLWVAPSELDREGRPRDVTEGQRSHMVVWNRMIFPEDFLLEVEMSPCGSTKGLALVLLCATGKNGEDIFDLSLPARRGDYATYHSGALANYTDSYWSRNTVEESLSNRLRKNPSFKQVASGPSLTTGPTDVTHRLRILKVGRHIEVEVNGEVVIRWDDPESPLGAGRIGLRSMAGVTQVAYDNFLVWRVLPRPNR
jgi:hypothetical protein